MLRGERDHPTNPSLTNVIRLLDGCIFGAYDPHWPEEQEATFKFIRGGDTGDRDDMEILTNNESNPVPEPNDMIDEEDEYSRTGMAKSQSDDYQPDTTLCARLGDLHERVVGGRQNIKVYCDAGGDGILQITFHRTVRIPENGRQCQLPPSLGELPIYSVKQYEKELPKSMVVKGGVFIPMYQREAMWMSFDADRPFAIKVYVGGINVISREPKIETPAVTARRLKLKKSNQPIQDYVVAGPTTKHQDWLDGIFKKDGSVAQFVAMRPGAGNTVEAHLVARESFGSIQIEILPIKYNRCMKVKIINAAEKPVWIDVTPNTTVWQISEILGHLENMEPQDIRLYYDGEPLNLDRTVAQYRIRQCDTIHTANEKKRTGREPGLAAPRKRGTGTEKDATNMTGIAAGSGIKQTVRKDFHPADIWDQEKAIAFNVHILNTSLFCKLTSLPPPPTPITVSTYAKLGYPFLSMYNEDIKSLSKGGLKLILNEDDEDHLGFPPITLDEVTNPTSFRPVAQLEAELETLKPPN